MAVRNFWVEADIDGYKTELKGGPRNKEGGMGITVYQRKEGCIERAVTISCWEADGDLITSVTIGGEWAGEYRTKR